MILAIDTSTAACSGALFAADGKCLRSFDELIGRGHAERLIPMVQSLLDGARPEQLLVGVGPGSFTGIRVGIAAAHGLAIGWGCPVLGMSSLALIVASVGVTETTAAVIDGGHGELFVQEFAAGIEPAGALINLPPEEAAKKVGARLAAGPAAERLAAARGSGTAVEAWPSARFAMKLPEQLRSLAPKPLYARAPDAKVRSAA